MLVRNASIYDIGKALRLTNEEFDRNITFRRLDFAGRTRQGGEKYTVTLTVNDSKESGARRSNTGRRISAACWHAYGTFMDNLPSGSEIVTSTSIGRTVKSPGDRWVDWNIGSRMYPMYYSDACECENY